MASQPHGYTFNNKISARVRLATVSDVPHLHKLIHLLALWHNHPFDATEASISNNLFKCNLLPPFESYTGLILEVSPNPFPLIISDHPIFIPFVKTFDLDEPIIDTESELFRSSGLQDDIFVAGYALLYPHYFSFLRNPGIFVDNMYIRKSYRSVRLGALMYSVVASVAAKKSCSVVDQLVATWNMNPQKLLTKMGCQVVEDIRLHRLSGKELQAHENDLPNENYPKISARM